MYMSVPIGPCGSYDPVIHYVQPYIAIGVGVVVGVGVGVGRLVDEDRAVDAIDAVARAL